MMEIDLAKIADKILERRLRDLLKDEKAYYHICEVISEAVFKVMTEYFKTQDGIDFMNKWFKEHK